jgi:hypothetical protein
MVWIEEEREMTYRIATLDPTDARPMRHNDGSMIIMYGEPGGDGTRPALLVPMIIRPKRGDAWKTHDPQQEEFAKKVVDLLNGDAA